MRHIIALTLAAAVIALPASADDRPPPARTDPAHFGTLPYNSDGDPARAAPRAPYQVLQRIVYAFDRPAAQVLAADAALTAQCRRGRFNQRIAFRYRAFGPGERPLGVAFGYMATNLVDPGRLRRGDTVYFFRDHDTSRCTVLTATLESLRGWFVPP
ncbi:hypothetical protein HHL28_01710 [Aerophototrophica crusticola]|uniref:Uncharacterized protein n=1 Tax=Aerophototrophica crusticola TaxID=1709002 RepID=A0A858R3J7_9PROT|nr:hypothetical protein HHL28_01710 [Rhodospirillaceae bacterium B3]